jgi:hypothetical protein
MVPSFFDLVPPFFHHASIIFHHCSIIVPFFHHFPPFCPSFSGGYIPFRCRGTAGTCLGGHLSQQSLQLQKVDGLLEVHKSLGKAEMV